MVQPNSDKSAWWLKETYTQEEMDQLVQYGLEHFWMQNHQMADLRAPGAYGIMVRGDGCYVYDIEGKKYIDGMAGLYLKNVGHNRPEIAQAVYEQMTTLAYANSGAYSNVPGILLAKKIAELAPGNLDRVFFCGGGAEAVEIALKMARQYQFLRGHHQKTKVISRRGQYHGSTYATMSIGNRGRNMSGMFEPLMPGTMQVDPPYCYRCPWGFQDRTNKSCCMLSVKALQNVIEGEGADTIAAFIATPIPSGNQIPADDYWPKVRELCTKHNIILIADEVICGYGRLGTWFGMERFGVVPDIMTNAKGLTSGELPVGAVVASREIAETFDKTEGNNGQFHHGVTFGGHPAVMAAGLKNLEIIERERLVENSDRMGRYLYDRAVSVLQENHPTVGFVGGGLGLLMAIEIVKDRKTKERYPGGFNSPFTKRFTDLLRGNGLAVRAGDTIILSPPLTITRAIVDDMVDILDTSLTTMEREFPPA
ncbi:MAG: aspartate aminotransferase family protein [Chloroflexi bacterium]|nr:aspartate aminotransferase family protein [Chloroflexota bacterium]